MDNYGNALDSNVFAVSIYPSENSKDKEMFLSTLCDCSMNCSFTTLKRSLSQRIILRKMIPPFLFFSRIKSRLGRP
jgi:hypothetical protein